MIVSSPESEKNIAYYHKLVAKSNKTYFTDIGKKSIGRTRFDYIPFGVSSRARAEVFYSLVDNPVFVKDKTTEEYLESLVIGKNCYCDNGKILMQVTTTIL